jgi:hypothetical protein
MPAAQSRRDWWEWCTAHRRAARVAGGKQCIVIGAPPFARVLVVIDCRRRLVVEVGADEYHLHTAAFGQIRGGATIR